ncbi:hypothetical protein [Pseudomarimonas arenosa]|uniref:Uncharacterized protein n=1 Tax=Pseudomarimonas arenosa TaxID=2774145 RepID=A0AAW3ZFE2_9GAMM|nr:hypothetical protein [Pseudomarimonas arenosa]MBD8524618.1 hypothetical protein [Pseudomarimonas arenosa]
MSSMFGRSGAAQAQSRKQISKPLRFMFEPCLKASILLQVVGENQKGWLDEDAPLTTGCALDALLPCSRPPHTGQRLLVREYTAAVESEQVWASSLAMNDE